MALTPPTLAHHGHFRPDLPRTLIREYKLPCSPSRFFARYWSTKDCYMTFGDGMGFSKMVVGEWSVSGDGGYIQRNCSWIIPVGSFAVGGITPVNQTQRARFQNKNLLIIELTTSTPDVPYGNAFTIEQQYEINDLGDDSLNLRTSCGIYWNTNPWGASMVSGTIESRSFEETTKSTCHLLALIEQDLKNLEQAQLEAKQLTIEKKRKKSRREGGEKGEKKERRHHHRRGARIENNQVENKEEEEEEEITKNVMKEENAEDAYSSSLKESSTNYSLPIKDLESESISPFKSISLPSTSRTSVSRDDISPTSNAWTKISSIFTQVLGKCFDLLKLFLASEIFQIVCLCLISVMVLLLYSRVITLESRLSTQLENDNLKKVQFLQRFVKDLAFNMTGDSNLYDSHLVAWRSNNLIQSALADWQKQIVNLMKNIRKQSDFTSSSAVDFTQDLLKKLEEHTLFMENMMPYETWSAWLFYWISVASVIGVCITVLIFYKTNKEKAD